MVRVLQLVSQVAYYEGPNDTFKVEDFMAPQPLQAPGPVCQQTAKSRKENIFTTNQVGVASRHA